MTGMSLRIVITCLLDNIATLWGGYMLITFGSWRVKVDFSNWGVLCCSYVCLLCSSLNTTYKTLLPRNFWNATKNPRTFTARSTVTDFFTLIGALLNTNWSLIDKGIPPSFLAKIYKIKKQKGKQHKNKINVNNKDSTSQKNTSIRFLNHSTSLVPILCSFETKGTMGLVFDVMGCCTGINFGLIADLTQNWGHLTES